MYLVLGTLVLGTMAWDAEVPIAAEAVLVETGVGVGTGAVLVGIDVLVGIETGAEDAEGAEGTEATVLGAPVMFLPGC